MELLGVHLSPYFYWTFFQACISHHGCTKFQIYGQLQFLEDVLSSQIIGSRYFYSYATISLPLFPLSPLQSQATMAWNIRLFYMICNLFKCDDVIVL